MNTQEKIAEGNRQIEEQWGLMHYALYNLMQQAKQDVADAILSSVKDHGPKDRPIAGTLSAVGLIKQRINTATLIAMKIGGYTYEQMVSEWRFETGMTGKAAVR